MWLQDMKVFFNGVELVDPDTLHERWIDDDCILHCVGTASMPTTRVVKSSVELHQWRRLLAHNLKPPIKDKVVETELNPRPLPQGYWCLGPVCFRIVYQWYHMTLAILSTMVGTGQYFI